MENKESNEKSVEEKQAKSGDNCGQDLNNEGLNQMKKSVDSLKSETKPIEGNIKPLDERKEKKETVKEKPKESGAPLPLSPQLSVKSRSNSMESMDTIESAKQLKALDTYICEEHWNLNIQYILTSVSSVLWSLLIIYFITRKINTKCYESRVTIVLTSLVIAITSSLESVGVCLLWYTKLANLLLRRTKLCFAVITIHIILGSFNLLMAIICFGSKTCYELHKLYKSEEDYVPIRYEVKTLSTLHMLIAITFFICAMLLAIKRNDFKYYVLWRNGVLDDYLSKLYDED